MTTIKDKTLRLVQLGLLSGLIILLQAFIVIPLPGSLTLTLVLVPIVVGAVLYGPKAGALLGGVFGATVSWMAVQLQLGLLTNMMVEYNAVLTVIICMLKGIAAGWVAGLIAAAFKNSSKPFVGILLAAAAAPIVNTGIFLLGIFTVFKDVALEWAAKPEIGYTGGSILYIAIFLLVGMNFVIEFAANLILAPSISSIVKAVKKMH
ncbi:MAG: ECF transporter S component [Ruminococcaceae bacterium]|nr:ECF transporter S component [Oscillospiraceae bacterium]